MRKRHNGRVPRQMSQIPYRAVRHALLGGAMRVWHDLRFRDLYRSGKEFELMGRAMGFAALAMLTVFPLLVLVAAASAVAHHGLAGGGPETPIGTRRILLAPPGPHRRS